MLDDVPRKDKLYQDLIFIQDHFKGVMPYEIVIDTREPDGLKNPVTLQKIYKLQKKLENQADFSRAISVVEVLKFANQSYNDGNPDYYRLPNNIDLAEIASYIPQNQSNQNMLKSMVDKDFRKARISIQMRDVGSEKMEEINKDVNEIIKEIFPE
jgi:predicted RND superfamily exporter protein